MMFIGDKIEFFAALNSLHEYYAKQRSLEGLDRLEGWFSKYIKQVDQKQNVVSLGSYFFFFF